MLKIERAIFDQLGFDFDAALQRFAAEKQHHPFTIDIPAPTANYLVEAAYAAGGYEIVEPKAEPEPIPPAVGFVPDPRKPEAMAKLRSLKGQHAEVQLEEIRHLLLLVFELLPV